MPKLYPPNVKEKARQLRRQGYSFGDLVKNLGISRSTLFEWAKDINSPTRYAQIGRKAWLKEIQQLGAQTKRKQRQEYIANFRASADDEFKEINLDRTILRMLLALLYWAEGTKTRGVVRFANTDPQLVLLFVVLLRQCFDLDEQKFRLALHLHWYHKEKEVKRYWSMLLKIPESQFNKTYRKKRSKEKRFRKNLGGICFVRYNSVYLKEQIMQYAYALADNICGKAFVRP